MVATSGPRPPNTHACPGGCGVQVRSNLFACPSDWYRLPYEIRKAISTHYRRDPGAHFTAMSDAMEWYSNHPLPATPEVTA